MLAVVCYNAIGLANVADGHFLIKIVHGVCAPPPVPTLKVFSFNPLAYCTWVGNRVHGVVVGRPVINCPVVSSSSFGVPQW